MSSPGSALGSTPYLFSPVSPAVQNNTNIQIAKPKINKSGIKNPMPAEVRVEGLIPDINADKPENTITIANAIIAKYKNNKIAPLLLPTVILQAARMYNDAFVLVEINSIGLQVSDILHF